MPLRAVMVMGLALLLPRAGLAQEPVTSKSTAGVESLAMKVRAAVQAEDVASLLSLVADNGVTCVEGDYVASKKELREQFGRRRGHVFAMLFDTAQLARLEGRASEAGSSSVRPCFREYFLKHPKSFVDVRGDAASGYLVWQLSAVELGINVPTFRYSWNEQKRRYEILTIGCE
jgi:hypothetical protein